LFELTREGYQRKLVVRNIGPGKTLALDENDAQLIPIPAPKPSEPTPARTEPPPPPPDPRVIEAQDWERVKNSRDSADFAEFLKKHPAGQFSAQAAGRIEEIEWAKVNKNDSQALEAFVARRPSGAYAIQAKNAIAQLEKAEQQKREAERLSVAREQIRAVLKSYAGAYERKDLGAIVALWPDIPKEARDSLQNVFRNFPSGISMQLTPTGEPEIVGETAHLVCVSVSNDLKAKANLRFTFTRLNGRWIIKSVQRL
jgi:hypothetical protein